MDSQRESSASSADGESIIKHFLSGTNLRKVFSYLCNHASGHATDPVSNIVHIMLTCPVQMVVSEVRCVTDSPTLRRHLKPTAETQVGVAFFKDHPDALYPFSAMDRGQRMYVEQVVAACMAAHQRRSALQSMTNDAASRQVPEPSSRLEFNNRVVMQMGGGCILYVEASASNNTKALEPRDVFEALCDCVFASKR